MKTFNASFLLKIRVEYQYHCMQTIIKNDQTNYPYD
jgi:hypothetical protein